MTILALLKGLAFGALLSGLLGGILAIYGTVTADQFDIIGPAVIIGVLAAVTGYALWRDRLARRDGADRPPVRDRTARQARGRHARAAGEPAETQPALPALPDGEPHDPTEPVLTVTGAAVKPGALFRDWGTGQFELDIQRLDAERHGGAA